MRTHMHKPQTKNSYTENERRRRDIDLFYRENPNRIDPYVDKKDDPVDAQGKPTYRNPRLPCPSLLRLKFPFFIPCCTIL